MGNDLRAQQIVQELIGFVFIFGIRRHGEDIKEGQRSLFRNKVGDIDAVLRLFGPIRRLPNIARPADSDANIAVCQVIDILRRVEVTDIGPQLQQQIGCRSGVIIGFGAVWIFAEIVQHRRENLFRGIKEGDAAAFQLLKVFRFEHQIPAVQRRVFAQRRFHFIDVIADAGGRPHVWHRIFIIGIVTRHQL